METIKLYGKVQTELAREFAGIVGGSVVVEGGCIRFDADDAAELRAVAEDAASYLMRRGKRSRAGTADDLREQFSIIEINDRYLSRFA
jgi:hypothetical protein